VPGRLDGLRSAVDAVADARSALHAAIREAHEAGERVQAIADATGYSRQRIYQIVGPKPKADWRETAETRLAELDARWNALVDQVAEVERPPDAHIKRENAKRNGRRGKDARKGLKPRPSVLQEARSFAESKLLRVLLDHAQDARVVAIVAEIDEAHALRQALEAAYDRSLGIAD
jgi:hypothetical protein